VAISIGGIEIGQGINTKVAQVVARELGITSADLISVKPANSFVAANSDITGGSLTSDWCIFVCKIKCASHQLHIASV